ncbi:pyridoxamine kinase [Neisseriaceae bacterium B1]
MSDKKVMTIQDISCYGQCSLTVALPIISACGIETAILPSAVLSTHTGGFTGYTFRDLADDIPAIYQHWQKEGISFDAIYSGYLGSKRQIDDVIHMMNTLLTANGVKIVDPAMADNGKLYYGFDDKHVKAMARLCGQADIMLPNITEAAFMTNSECRMEGQDEAYIDDLLAKLAKLGAKTIILKGLTYVPNKLGLVVYDVASGEKFVYLNDRVDYASHGTGDCYAAAFTGALMQGRTIEQAASLAADFVVECLHKTIDDQSHWYGVKFEKALPMLVNELNK